MNAEGRSDLSASRPSEDSRLPYIATLVAILVIWGWYAAGLGAADISRFDEFFTLERSAGFARFDDWWAVYSNSAPSLKKPPLQYWISGLLMEWGVATTTALRIPSILFGLGTLCATAWLARLFSPRRPWAMFASVLFLGCAWEFWKHARSAMLDSGATFFATLGIACMVAAFERPRYWYAFAAATFLAGMQKAPTPLFFLGAALVTLLVTRAAAPAWQKLGLRDILRSRAFLVSLAVAIVAGFAWPIFQWLRFGGQPMEGGVQTEMLERFAPAIDLRGLEELSDLVFHGEPFLRGLGLLCVVMLPFRMHRPALVACTGIALFFVLGVWLASGSVYPRYSLLIVPMLMAALGAVVMSQAPHPKRGLWTLAVIALLAGTPLDWRAREAPYQSAEKFGQPLENILERLSRDLREDELLVACGATEFPRVHRGAISHYVAFKRDYVYYRSGGLAPYLRDLDNYDGPMRGLCHKGAMDDIAPGLESLEIQPIEGSDFVYWTATGFDWDSD